MILCGVGGCWHWAGHKGRHSWESGVSVDLLVRERDMQLMRVAIDAAWDGLGKGKRPFGCVIYSPFAGVNSTGDIVAIEIDSHRPTDPTSHSEIKAIRTAATRLGSYLKGCTLYSTLEPCSMCCGAINHAKISRVIFGAWRTDLGGSLRARDLGVERRLADTSHPPEVRGGVLRSECVALTAADAEIRERLPGNWVPPKAVS